MRCAKCGIELPKTAKFCVECGTNQQDSYITSESHPEPTRESGIPEPERRHVTALFSDLCEYTAMSEKLDPEQVREITGQVFRNVKRIIVKHDGFIERVMGDGVLAFFGIPSRHEDDPIRAIQAATEIHDHVFSMSPHYEQTFGVRLAMHSGIDTGLVVTAEVDTEEGVYGVSGDAVNVARKLSDLAEPGEIIVGRDIQLRAAGFFSFEDRGYRRFKGKAEPVHVFKVLKAKAGSGVIRFEKRMSMEMIGRHQELERLESQVLKTIDGQGSVVSIIGEAGIGKSRLVAELKRRDIMKRVTMLEGRAVAMGKHLSFHPIIDLLKQWVGISERDSERQAFERLEQSILRVHPGAAHEILPFVARVMGMKLVGKHFERVNGIEGEALEKLIIKSFRELVIKAAELEPIVIVMEDLHWADGSSLLLLASLYRLTPKHRITFLNLFRPGYFESGGADIAEMMRALPVALVELEIHPLARHESESLIENVLETKNLPVSVKNNIVERSAGNPFFIEEVICSLIDQGAVVKQNGGFEVTEKMDSVVIPPTIYDVLMARIDRLEERTRNLLKVASVIGRSFFDRVFKDVSGGNGDVDQRLEQLRAAQLIQSRMRMGELEHIFRHALVQEAAYESNLLKHRKQLHLAVAQSIERIFGDRLSEFYGILAYHYGKAESLDTAEAWLTKAGEEAIKSSASNEALYYYQEALKIYRLLHGDGADPEKVAMLEKNIGLALFARGHYTEAVEHFDEALNYYWDELPKNTFATTYRFLAGFVTFLLALYFPSRWFNKIPNLRDTEAVDLFFRKAQALSVIDPKRFFVEFFLFQATFVHFDLTRFKMGVGIFAGANALFSFTGLSFSTARRILDYAKPRLARHDAKQCIGYDQLDTMTLFLKGQWHEITELNEGLVNGVLRIGELWDAGMNYYWHGLPKIYQAHFDSARLMVTKLNEIAETYENDVCHLLKYLLNSHLLIECRHLEEGLVEADRGMEFIQEKGSGLSILHMYSLRAWMLLLMDETEEAGKSLDKANQVRREAKVPPIQESIFQRSKFLYYLRRLEDALGRGHRKEVCEHRRNALKSGKMLIRTCRKAAFLGPESCRLMGVYHWLNKDPKNAFHWWHRAIVKGQSMATRPQLARTYAEMAVSACSVKGESSEPAVKRAEEYLQKARAMFSDMGLRYDLDHLNSEIGSLGIGPSEG